MYKVLKDAGMRENVYLKNTDTMGEVNLGSPSLDIITILKEDGYTIEDTIDPSMKWDLKVSEDAKEQLIKTAMPIKRPKRSKPAPAEELAAQPEQPAQTQTTKDGKPVVDILDIIYGLA